MTQGGVDWEIAEARKKLDDGHAAYATAVRSGASAQAAQSVLFVLGRVEELISKVDALVARVERLEAGR